MHRSIRSHGDAATRVYKSRVSRMITTVLCISHAINGAAAEHHRQTHVPRNATPVAGVGLLVVDVRANEKIGDDEGYVMGWLNSMQFTAPLIRVELWIGQTTLLHETLREHINERNGLISVRRMPLVNAERDVPRGLDLNTGNGGHVGKAYALAHSAFEIPVLMDSDVYACDGWIQKLYETINWNLKADIIWSFANHANPDDKNGKADNRFNHVSPGIDGQLEEYGEFAERNTGTVVVVRKTDATKSFLDDVLAIFSKLEAAGMVHSGDIKKFVGTAGEKIGHDQGAFREAMFLHRHKITETVMPAGKDANRRKAWACRPPAHGAKIRLAQCGRCGVPCFLMHSKPCFKKLLWRYGSSYGGKDTHVSRAAANAILLNGTEDNIAMLDLAVLRLFPVELLRSDRKTYKAALQANQDKLSKPQLIRLRALRRKEEGA